MFLRSCQFALVACVMLLSQIANSGKHAANMAVVSWLLQTESTSEASWGANPPSQSMRPQMGWLSNFDGLTPIEVPSEGIAGIEAGLEACAPDAYCVLQLDQLLLLDTLYLDRSKTMLLGKTANQIRYADADPLTGAFIEEGDDVNEVVIEGLNLDGESTAYDNQDVYGILIYGQGQNNIAILDNHIFNLNSNSDAHAIAVYGTGSAQNNAIRNVLIEGNHIHDIRTGSSETLAMNGNVSNWQLSWNRIERVNNIAIGLIGGEGTSPTRLLSGRVLPGLLDAARNGFVENNIVNDMSTVGNPAYGSVHSWAGAIYVDGAHTLSISNNVVSNSEWGYDIGAENCVIAHDILMQNNAVSGSYYGDLLLGGYAQTGYKDNVNIGCDPLNSVDDDEGHGYVENITVKNNQLNTDMPVDDQGSPNLQFRIRQSIIVQTPVEEEHPDGVISGDQRSIRIAE